MIRPVVPGDKVRVRDVYAVDTMRGHIFTVVKVDPDSLEVLLDVTDFHNTIDEDIGWQAFDETGDISGLHWWVGADEIEPAGPHIIREAVHITRELLNG